VSEVRDFGLPGVDLASGDHICAMYLGQRERDDIVLPYLRAGLRAGDKVICIIDSSPLKDLAASIGDEREVEGYIASQQLELHTPDEAYLRTPPFSTEAMLEFWDSSVGAAVTGGLYGFARGTGEMPWDRVLPLRGRTQRIRAALPAGDRLPVRPGAIRGRLPGRPVADPPEAPHGWARPGEPALPRPWRGRRDNLTSPSLRRA
jgi:MEDS: MEthanogen/methylotroph, DcmR Sensory domain